MRWRHFTTFLARCVTVGCCLLFLALLRIDFPILGGPGAGQYQGWGVGWVGVGWRLFFRHIYIYIHVYIHILLFLFFFSFFWGRSDSSPELPRFPQPRPSPAEMRYGFSNNPSTGRDVLCLVLSFHRERERILTLPLSKKRKKAERVLSLSAFFFLSKKIESFLSVFLC